MFLQLENDQSQVAIAGNFPLRNGNEMNTQKDLARRRSTPSLFTTAEEEEVKVK